MLVSLSRLIVGAALFVLTCTTAAGEGAVDAAHDLQRAYAAVAEQTRPSIVCVTSYVRDTAPRSESKPTETWENADRENFPGFSRLAAASGIVLNDDGVVLSCRHALVTPDGRLADAVDIETPSNQHYVATILGSEPTINLAVLKIETFHEQAPPDIKPATIGTLDTVKPGYTAIAIGDPFGPLQTFATGVFAGFPQRDCYQADLTSTFIQASLTVHAESYGGALVSLEGEVIGILMPPASASGSTNLEAPKGFTFALPIGTAMAVGEALKFKQTHQSPWMGFAVLDLRGLRIKLGDMQQFNAMKRPLHGLYIEDVFTPSPATNADIRVGDFILAIDGQRLDSVADFQKALYLAGIGHTVAIEVFRGGEVSTKSLTVELRPTNANRP